MQYKFLLYISYSYALPIGEPLEEEILKRGYEVKWFSDLEDGKKAIANKNNLLSNIREVVNYKPHIVLTATNEVPDFIYGLKVQIFHGFLSKKRPRKNTIDKHFRIRGFFDLYCTQGPSTTAEFKKLSKKFNHFEVIETGWSKVDSLFPSEKASIKKTNPIIMIASTFTEKLSLSYNEDVFQKIKQLASIGTYKFIMVLHPKLPKHIFDKWKSLVNEHFTFYETTKLTPLFKKADILFADTTSAIQEFVLQEKPVVTFRHRVEEDFLINITEPDEIENAFAIALNPPTIVIEKIKNYIKKLHPYKDGKSSARVVDTCINFLHQDKSRLKSKPLNLIRKYKIRKRLNFFTFKSYNKPFTIEE